MGEAAGRVGLVGLVGVVSLGGGHGGRIWQRIFFLGKRNQSLRIKFSELFRAGLRVKMKGHLGRVWPRYDIRLIDLDFLGGGFIRFFMFNPIFGEMILLDYYV